MISGRFTFFLAIFGTCTVALWTTWGVVSRMTGFEPWVDEQTEAVGGATEGYSRNAFGGWVDADGDCLNTRAEILVERSLTDPVLNETGCRVVGGSWVDVYSGEVLADPARIDVDHVVPLHYAWDAGASSWSDAERIEFMNDPQNLVLTTDSINSGKSDALPGEWLPPNPDSHCTYVSTFLSVLQNHDLPLPQESIILELADQMCGQGVSHMAVTQ